MLFFTTGSVRDYCLDLFDTIMAKMVAQGQLSFDTKNGTCAYRLDGRADCKVRCPVGHAVSDEHYLPSLEGKTATEPEIKLALALSGIQGTTPVRMLCFMQDNHDKCTFNGVGFQPFVEKMRYYRMLN